LSNESTTALSFVDLKRTTWSCLGSYTLHDIGPVMPAIGALASTPFQPGRTRSSTRAGSFRSFRVYGVAGLDSRWLGSVRGAEALSPVAMFFLDGSHACIWGAVSGFWAWSCLLWSTPWDFLSCAGGPNTARGERKEINW
jgi:hypothetical protein